MGQPCGEAHMTEDGGIASEPHEQPHKWAFKRPFEPLDEAAAQTDTLSSACETSGTACETLSQKHQLNHSQMPDPQESWDNRCLLF